MRFLAESEIPPSHPSLRGHFPGFPIVPGVVLLDTVIETARQQLGDSFKLVTIPHVKFVAPLGAGIRFGVELSGEPPGALRFKVETTERVIATGSLRYAL